MPNSAPLVSLVPGRELDARIAETIFGWVNCGEKQMWSLPENPEAGGEAEPDGTEWMGQLPPHQRTHPEQHLHLRHYSTLIAAAWLIVGKLQRYPADRWTAFDEALRTRVLPSLHATALHELEPSVAAYAICVAAIEASPPPAVPDGVGESV